MKSAVVVRYDLAFSVCSYNNNVSLQIPKSFLRSFFQC
jgi:hypothetical protein